MFSYEYIIIYTMKGLPSLPKGKADGCPHPLKKQRGNVHHQPLSSKENGTTILYLFISIYIYISLCWFC